MSLKSCQTAYGPCKFYGKDSYIGRSLYAYGEWSGDECDRLVSLANGLCIDVGANIGFMTMALASKCPVMAFEPQKELFKLLEENTADLPVAVFNCALGSVNGTAFMPKIRYGDKGNYGGVGLVKANSFSTVPVEIKTLDSFGFVDVGLIKIDVEGHELEVLKGAVDTIARFSPILYVEDDRLDKRDALRAFIKNLGYKIEEHQPRMFRKNNFAGNLTDIWEVPYESHNIICSK